MQLLSVADVPLSVAGLVRAGATLGIESNTLRVAVTRLKTQGLIESPRRGVYVLAAPARATQRQVLTWRTLHEHAIPWSGGWIGVHTAHLSQDRRRSRARFRALRFLGFAELVPGLHLRPDNLAGGVDGVRERLQQLGLESDAVVFVLRDLETHVEDQARSCWDIQAISERYRECRRQMRDASARLAHLPLEDAARDAFIVGSHVIRVLAFDPVLPAPMIDPHIRAACVRDMLAFDERGKMLWRQILEVDTL